MFHWIGKWWRSNTGNAIVHNHYEGFRCNSGCVTQREWRANERALRAVNVGKHRR